MSTHNRQAEEARTKLNELQDMLALLHEVVGSIYMYTCMYMYMYCISMMSLGPWSWERCSCCLQTRGGGGV